MASDVRIVLNNHHEKKLSFETTSIVIKLKLGENICIVFDNAEKPSQYLYDIALIKVPNLVLQK